MKEHRLTLKDGYDRIKAVRPIAAPNQSFVIQLKLYEKELFGKNSETQFKLVKLKYDKYTKQLDTIKSKGSPKREEETLID